VAKVTVQIDRDELLENFMGDEELLLESIELFLTRVEDRYKTLDTAVKEQDAQKVMEEGHTIKGMVGIFTTSDPFEAAKKIEFMGRNKELGGVEDALADFRAKLDELRVLLENWRKELVE
jgi:HPt (histidine-containing phosphotransfer) domain-containing protein